MWETKGGGKQEGGEEGGKQKSEKHGLIKPKIGTDFESALHQILTDGFHLFLSLAHNIRKQQSDNTEVSHTLELK